MAVPAGGVKDESGNLNTASDTLSITFDRTAFKPSLTADATSPTNSPSVTITVDFGEPINATTFALADDVTVTGGTVSGLAHLSGNRTFTFTLVPDGDGTATVAVPAGGVKDESGNLNTASDTLSITFDRTAFKPSLTADATSPTNSPSVTITVDFGEPINATTFALADDVTVTGGTVSGLAHLSGNRTFTFTSPRPRTAPPPWQSPPAASRTSRATSTPPPTRCPSPLTGRPQARPSPCLPTPHPRPTPPRSP